MILRGRAAELLEAVDWDAHVLGGRASWPVALRVMLGTMLGSPESMYLVWGPERTFFFNDAYMPILGPRLPLAMGARFETLWADAWPTVEPAFLKAEAGESTRFVDMPVPMARYDAPEETWWAFSYSPVRDAAGAIVGVLCHTNETTDRVRGEEARARAVAQQDLLNRELSHRVKNTMAMVQALATQSLKRVEDRRAVLAFEDRLVALGHAHDILLQDSWQPASIGSIVGRVLEVHNGRGQFVTEGPDVMLAARATLSLSLLLHELATNAAKYGALTADAGQVFIAWAIEGEGPAARFVLRWREAGGPKVVPPSRQGFGSRLIGMGLGGNRDADLRYDPAGFQARFSTPLGLLDQE